MRLESRLEKLEEAMSTNDYVIFSVFSGEDASVKQAQAWNEYKVQGGPQDYAKTTFVRINKLIK